MPAAETNESANGIALFCCNQRITLTLEDCSAEEREHLFYGECAVCKEEMHLSVVAPESQT